VAVCSGFGDQKIGYRDEDVWNGRMVAAGTGRTTELGRALRMAVAGRAWRMAVAGRSSRSTMGRKWVDGEREGKIWGEALN
jgi:hypothetical protein